MQPYDVVFSVFEGLVAKNRASCAGNINAGIGIFIGGIADYRKINCKKKELKAHFPAIIKSIRVIYIYAMNNF